MSSEQFFGGEGFGCNGLCATSARPLPFQKKKALKSAQAIAKEDTNA